MRCQPVEYVCRNGRTAEEVGDADDGGNRHGVEQDDEQAVHECLETSGCRGG